MVFPEVFAEAPKQPTSCPAFFSSCAPSISMLPVAYRTYFSLVWQLTSLWLTSVRTSSGRHHNQTPPPPQAKEAETSMWQDPGWEEKEMPPIPLQCAHCRGKQTQQSSHPVCPDADSKHLQDLIPNRSLERHPPRRVSPA